MLLVKNNSASPSNGVVRIGRERLPFRFFSWQEKELPDEIAVLVRDINPRKFLLRSCPSEDTADVKDLKMQIRVLKRKLTLAEKELDRLKEADNEDG